MSATEHATHCEVIFRTAVFQLPVDAITLGPAGEVDDLSGKKHKPTPENRPYSVKMTSDIFAAMTTIFPYM